MLSKKRPKTRRWIVGSLDDPIGGWANPFIEAIATAEPSSPLFKEFLKWAVRTEVDEPDFVFAAADVASVMREKGKSLVDLASDLFVPVSYMYAVARGWKRLGIRGLGHVAEALDVPLSRFILDPEGVTRFEVQRYNAYLHVAPRVTILGS